MWKRTAAAFALVFATLALTASAFAQDDPQAPATFTSDRPGFSNTTGVAAVGRLTTEGGVLAGIDDEAPYGSLPQLSLRVGLFDWLEARWRGPNAIGDFGPMGPRFGLADPSVGFKVGARASPELAVSSVWEVSMPIATDFGGGAPEAELFVDFTLDWTFFGPLTLTPNLVLGIEADVDPATGDTRRYFEGGGSLKLTWQILDVLGAYAQGFALASEYSDWRVAVGAGLFWRVVPNVQVDASFDVGVTDDPLTQPPTVQAGTTILW